jgi:flagellar L-ring protein FlgH
MSNMLRPRVPDAIIALTVGVFLLLAPASPATAKNDKKNKADTDSTAQALSDYIARVKATGGASAGFSEGSLWTPQARWASLATDDKAHNVGDIVTILLADSYSSSANNSIKTQRTVNAQTGISSLFGTLGANNSLQNIFSPSSSENLSGQGQSAISTSLNVTMAGQIMDVLPNGMLIVQAARNMNVGNERQTIIVRGILRPDDISPADIASSTSLTNLEVEVRGKGVISDGTRPPNFIVRALFKILDF